MDTHACPTAARVRGANSKDRPETWFRMKICFFGDNLLARSLVALVVRPSRANFISNESRVTNEALQVVQKETESIACSHSVTPSLEYQLSVSSSRNMCEYCVQLLSDR